MDTQFIDDLIAIMRRENVVELEYEAEGKRIRLKLAEDGTILRRATKTPEPLDVTDESTPQGTAVHAGMAGCFYRAPSPGEAPFVEVGDRVAEGQTLALLEAMKMMTPVEAESSGVVAQIHVGNGDMVRAGDILISLDPDRS